jgi:hypothetical protein
MPIIREHPQGAGVCAKRIVHAALFTADGEQYLSSNYCLNPQTSCPRADGEGYEKCRTICQQPGHAETNVIRMAGKKARGSTVLVFGHDRACDACQQACEEQGIGLRVLGL